MIFDLVKDFADALDAMPKEHPCSRIIKLLDEAIRRDVHFINRHPTTFFQCMWNTCWWYDCPAHNEGKFENESSGVTADIRLFQLVEKWHSLKQNDIPDSYWVKSLSPPMTMLGTGLQTVLVGHHDKVTAVTISRDGKQIASTSADKTIKVWDAITGAEIDTLKIDTLDPAGVEYSEDGRFLRVKQKRNGETKTFQVGSWIEVPDEDDRSSLKINHQYTEKRKGRHADSATPATVRSDGKAVQIQNDQKKLLAVAGWHDGTITNLAVSPNCIWIASRSSDEMVNLWKFTKAIRKATLSRIFDWIHRWWSQYESRIVQRGTRALRGPMTIENHDQIEETWNRKFYRVNLFSVWLRRCFNRILNTKVSTLIESDSLTESQKERYFTDQRMFGDFLDSESDSPLKFSPEDRLLAVGLDHRLQVWDCETCNEVVTWIGHLYQITDLSFSIDGDLLVSSSEDSNICVWNLIEAPNSRQASKEAPPLDVIKLSPKGEWMATANSLAKGVELFRVHTNPESISFNPERVLMGENRCTAVEFSPNRKHIAVAEGYDPYGGYSIYLFDLESGQQKLKLQGHTAEVRCLCFSNNGDILFSVSEDKTVRRWNTQDGTLQSTQRAYPEHLEGMVDQVYGISEVDFLTLIAAAPDRDEYVGAFMNGKVIRRGANGPWKIGFSEGEVSCIPQGTQVTQIAFSQDGNLCYLQSLREITIWDIETKQFHIFTSVTGNVDLETIASNEEYFPFVVESGERETTIKCHATFTPAGWFPQLMDNLSHDPLNRFCCGTTKGTRQFQSIAFVKMKELNENSDSYSVTEP